MSTPTPKPALTIVSLHSGGGSMVEGADAVAAYGLFTEDDAEKICDTLNNLLGKYARKIPDAYLNECWAMSTTFEPPPIKTIMSDGSPVPQGSTAIDLDAMIKALVDRWDD